MVPVTKVHGEKGLGSDVSLSNFQKRHQKVNANRDDYILFDNFHIWSVFAKLRQSTRSYE